MSLSKQTHDVASCNLDIIESPEASHTKTSVMHTRLGQTCLTLAELAGRMEGSSLERVPRTHGPIRQTWLVLRNRFIAGTSDELKQADARCGIMLLRYH